MSETSSNLPTRISIVGGGCAGVAAAFWLSSTADLRSRFQVTLWTRGWRLGGKGASGRPADPAKGARIEEHGLHLWLGFYNNAFATMRAAFSAVQGSPGVFQSVEQAFSPVNDIVFMQRDAEGGGYSPWPASFPKRPGEPGDIHPEPEPFAALVNWMKSYLGPKLPEAVALHWDERLAASEALAKIYAGKEARPPRIEKDAPDVLLAQARDGAASLQQSVAAAWQAPLQEAERRLLILADLALALLIGYLVDLAPSGFSRAAYDRLDEKDFREWLGLRGACRESLDCGFLQGIYDLAFAYPGGDARDVNCGSIAAGVTLRLSESLAFGYRQAPVFKMMAGMGDTVFTPLYDALIRQNVDVKFFHALDDVVPTEDGQAIAALRMRRQADLLAPPYRPFVSVKGLRCWPSEPDWTQLANVDSPRARPNFEDTYDTTGTPFELKRGDDFDLVVLAMPPDSLALTTPKLRVSARWATMLDKSVTVATQAAQFWLQPSSQALGFPVQPPPPVAGYVEPLATWADMSHLLSREDWPEPAPKSLAYFCGPMRWALRGGEGEGEGEAQRETMDWLRRNIAGLWPQAPGGDIGPIVVSAYIRANIDPSERYVQIPPGSVGFRLAPDSKPFANLYLAGDWTRLPVSGGCVETAIQSGMVVARAITGAQIPIDDH